ncbi:hypothetical protein BDF14DRAFT_1013206 [Spinellus fusiger]|nr:hypothetical protein BDF14DRAFT_1013206 [Spinellus fusiger]
MAKGRDKSKGSTVKCRCLFNSGDGKIPTHSTKAQKAETRKAKRVNKKSAFQEYGTGGLDSQLEQLGLCTKDMISTPDLIRCIRRYDKIYVNLCDLRKKNTNAL